MLNSSLLDAVRAEISQHEAALAKLREIERLTVELLPAAKEPPALPRGARPPARVTSPRTSRTSVTQRKQAILAVVSTRGPISPSAIAEAVGEPVQSVRDSLRQLVAGKQLVGHGSTSDRTYDVARTNGNGNGSNGDHQISPRVRKEIERETSVGVGEVALEDRVVDVVKRAGGRVALSEIEYQLRRLHVNFDRPELERAASRLTTHGLVQRDPGGGLRMAERPLEDVALDVAGVDSL